MAQVPIFLNRSSSYCCKVFSVQRGIPAWKICENRHSELILYPKHKFNYQATSAGRSYRTSSVANKYSDSWYSATRKVREIIKLPQKSATKKKMADNIPEGILLGLGNPLLDISILADESFLKKYNLEANNAILADDVKHQQMYQDMMDYHRPDYIPGGATQNSIRVAQWLLKRPNATTFFGCVGNDKQGEILKQKAQEVGVNVRYQVDEREATGVCGAVITGENRSLVTSLAAASRFTHMFLEERENWEYVERAQYFYIGAFVFPVCTQAIIDVAKHACDQNKTLVMNLSAPFFCRYFVMADMDVISYIDILFGNGDEATEFCKLKGLSTDDLKQMALDVSNLPKKNNKRSRIVIFTQGKDPTFVAYEGKVFEHKIHPVEKSTIKDTNGCGDAFVGGFLSQLVLGKPLSDCLQCGNHAAKTVIQHFGCTFPDEPDFM